MASLVDYAHPPSLTSRIPFDGEPNDFLRCARFSPDGLSVLANSENRSIYVYELDSQTLEAPSSIRPDPTRRDFEQAAPILDTAWYPTASSQDPASYCFLASVRECPVKLLDAKDGRLRASYSIVDHRERQVAPHSLTFDPPAQRIYCGFEDAIETFDVNRPGQEGTRLHTTPSKKSKDGLKGIISALAFCPSYEYNMFAAGSFTPTTSNIAIYNDDNPVLSIGGCPKAGVTQLAFLPFQPHILLAAFRQNESIYAWDIRGNADEPVAIYDYSTDPGAASGARLTNQRMRFDLSWQGNFLAAGDQRGTMHIFDLNHPPPDQQDSPSSTPKIRPCQTIPAHKDAIGSVSFNNHYPALMSACGSRHFPEDDEDEDEGAGDKDKDLSSSSAARRTIPWVEESSLGFWIFDRHREGERGLEAIVG